MSIFFSKIALMVKPMATITCSMALTPSKYWLASCVCELIVICSEHWTGECESFSLTKTVASINLEKLNICKGLVLENALNVVAVIKFARMFVNQRTWWVKHFPLIFREAVKDRMRPSTVECWKWFFFLPPANKTQFSAGNVKWISHKGLMVVSKSLLKYNWI